MSLIIRSRSGESGFHFSPRTCSKKNFSTAEAFPYAAFDTPFCFSRDK